MKRDLQDLVLSKLSTGKLSVDSSGRVFGPTGIELGGSPSSGYKTLSIPISGSGLPRTRRTRTVKAHHVVWLNTYGVIPDGLYINHIDGNKLNNHISNLELVTPSENTKHAISIGLMDRSKPTVIGTDVSTAVLNEDKVRQIRDVVKAKGRRNPNNSGDRSGVTLQELADQFGVSKTTIHGILSGRLWNHVV